MAFAKLNPRVEEGVVGSGESRRPQFQVFYTLLEVEEGRSIEDYNLDEDGEETLANSYLTREEAEYAASLI